MFLQLDCYGLTDERSNRGPGRLARVTEMIGRWHVQIGSEIAERRMLISARQCCEATGSAAAQQDTLDNLVSALPSSAIISPKDERSREAVRLSMLHRC